MKKSKLIAPVVVFKELHDNNKDIYDIISEFIISAIHTNKKWHFNSTEITQLIENEFDFELPEAVIKTTLKRRLIKTGFLRFENGEYVVNEIETDVSKDFEEKYSSKKNLYKQTEEEFISYIQSTRLEPLSENEIELIRENIKHYLLGNGLNDTFTKEISAYIIQNQNNFDCQELGSNPAISLQIL